MLQYVPWKRITFTGKLFNVGEGGSATTMFFLLKCFIFMLLDITIWVALTFLSYKLMVWTFFTPSERGFYCDDKSIREPLVPNTISTTELLAFTLGCPFFLIFLADLLRTVRPRRKHISQVINRSTYAYLNFCIAFWLMTLAIDALKCLTGRIRPNFLSMCKPREWDDVCSVNSDAYVPLAHCTAGWKNSRNSKMSFPSGHAAASVFSTLFLVFYLRTMQINYPTLLLKCMYFIVSLFYIAFSLFCCVSRVSDSWHFPSDVLGGILLGTSLYFVFLHKNIIPHQ